MAHLAINQFWGSLKRYKVMNKSRKVRVFLEKETFEGYADKLLTDISRKRLQEKMKGGEIKYNYVDIDCKKFYEYVGADGCYKANKENGYYYMDEISAEYNAKTMWLEIEYRIIEWDKNNNHGRSRPPSYW